MVLQSTAGKSMVAGPMERKSHSSRLVHLPASGQLYPTTTFWTVFTVMLALSSLVATGVSQQPDGFISIDCGSKGFTEVNTELEWLPDEIHLDSVKQLTDRLIAVPVIVNLDDKTAATRDNARVLETAMTFIPSIASPSKYCYNLPVQNSTNYLLRAMFPNKNLTPIQQNVSVSGYSTRFYFTVDSTFISSIELHPVETQTIELVVTPLDDSLYICLVPLEDRSSMPAISSIELRPLADGMYVNGRGTSSESSNSAGRSNTGLRTTYLMTVSRLNFGGNESLPAIRFPIDAYDRLWYAARDASSKVTSRSTSDREFGNQNTNVDYPIEVVQSAWEGLTMSSNISFKFSIGATRSLRPIPSFYLTVYFYDVNPGQDSDTREVNIYLQDGDSDILWGSDGPVLSNESWTWWNSEQTFSADSPVFRIVPTASSTLPAMVNALELYGEFEAETRRTVEVDDSTIRDFSHAFEARMDTTGDPCLPVPWNWLVCSLEIPPRITQIKLTSAGVNGTLPTNFGSLDRLTVLDLSNNSFSGSLPESLVDVATLRELNLADNNLSGNLPYFNETSLLVNLETLSLRKNAFTGSLSSFFKALGPNSSISEIYLSHNSFTSSIPEEIGNLRQLKVLDLSFNLLSGEVDKELVKLPELRTLDLQNNALKGVLPKEIWSSESKLETVNLNYNNFSELNLTTWCFTMQESKRFSAFQQRIDLLHNDIRNVIFPSDCLERLPRPGDISSWLQTPRGFILLGENHWCNTVKNKKLATRYLCRSNEFEDFWTVDKNGDTTKKIVIGAVISGSVVLLMACILLLVLRRMWKRMKELRQIQEALAKEDVRPPFFKYDDLKAATREFSQNNELGKGAFGAVYKAVLVDGSIVAVKLLFPTEQNVADFLKEMVLITGIKHKNLIQLKGCCVRDRKRLLVYEYAENKNLAEALWGDQRCVMLTWAQRLKICVGIARGLCYLHEELQPRIIHRDIKPQNILLDKDWDAKIADFGLARPVDEASTQLATRIGGTLGYFSPEYATHGKLTEKLDVYSFGILVLEIVSGRQCIDLSLTATPDKIYLKDWAFKLYLEGKILDVVEKGLLAPGQEEEIQSVLKTALSCLNENHEKRPSMSQVVNLLSGSSTEDLAVDIVGQLRDQQRMYEGLFDPLGNSANFNGKQEKEDCALLQSTSSSYDPERLIELTVTKPR